MPRLGRMSNYLKAEIATGTSEVGDPRPANLSIFSAGSQHDRWRAALIGSRSSMSMPRWSQGASGRLCRTPRYRSVVRIYSNARLRINLRRRELQLTKEFLDLIYWRHSVSRRGIEGRDYRGRVGQERLRAWIGIPSRKEGPIAFGARLP